jgi:putative membrane protein
MTSHAHEHLFASAWDLDHIVVWLMPLALMWYARGFRIVHRQFPGWFPLWRSLSFAGGLLVVFLAVASPLHAWGEMRLYLHMSQHMLLTMLAPPLIWCGQPMIPLLRALPPRAARHVLSPLLTAPALRRIGRAVTHPMVCWTALSSAIIVWHLPRCYELVLHSELWHDVQHECFFVGALLFWWPVVGVWPSRSPWARWTMIPYLVSADLINTAQSAILSFSSRLLYPTYATVFHPPGFSAMADQALAGVIMWVPGSIAFLLPAIVLSMRIFERQSPARSYQPMLSGGR